MSEWESTGERIGREIGGKIGRALGEWMGQQLIREDDGDRSVSEQDSDVPSDEANTETVSETPNSRKELEELSYRELQQLAKEVGVKANTKKEEMVKNVADELGIDATE
ncbi:hypothetical protein ACFFQF_08680 [Haladaptatus pallidirubidus]|nr:hypothetical protein [Haladaptatus pallidirubidus]